MFFCMPPHSRDYCFHCLIYVPWSCLQWGAGKSITHTCCGGGIIWSGQVNYDFIVSVMHVTVVHVIVMVISAIVFNYSVLKTYCQYLLVIYCWLSHRNKTSSSAVAKRPRDASYLSVVSFNSTKRQVESFIVSYVGYSVSLRAVKCAVLLSLA